MTTSNIAREFGVTVEEAVNTAERWFAHLDRMRARTAQLQKLAVLARTDHDEAKRQRDNVDRHPVVFDGAGLESAVRTLVGVVKGEAFK